MAKRSMLVAWTRRTEIATAGSPRRVRLTAGAEWLSAAKFSVCEELELVIGFGVDDQVVDACALVRRERLRDLLMGATEDRPGPIAVRLNARGPVRPITILGLLAGPGAGEKSAGEVHGGPVEADRPVGGPEGLDRLEVLVR